MITKMEGWIKIHRKIVNHWIYGNVNWRAWWIDLLLMAAWEDKTIEHDAHVFTLKRGQMIASISFLSQRWCVSNPTVIRYLKLLEKERMIIMETVSRRTSIITIHNFTRYQGANDDEANREAIKSGISNNDRFEHFKKRYLTYDTNHKISQPEKSYKRLINQKNIDWDKVKEYIAKEITYHDFLSTLYWKVISAYVKHINSFRCSNCGKEDNLHVHHLHYLNHGDELHNLDDLICLCAECHEKEHNIK